MPEADRVQLAQTINEQNLPWKANAYTQIDMEALEQQERKQGFGFAQVRGFGQSADFASILAEAQ